MFMCNTSREGKVDHLPLVDLNFATPHTKAQRRPVHVKLLLITCTVHALAFKGLKTIA